MVKLPFSESEMEIVSTVPNFRLPDAPEIPIFKYPITPKEAVLAAVSNEPVWCLYGTESRSFSPKIIPDNVARGFLVEKDPLPSERFGGLDMFGVEWEYVPLVGGSMVRPGNPLMTDANDWEKVIRFPSKAEIDTWGWENSAKENEEFLKNGKANYVWLQNGCWFERLISFMDVENACIALIDEEQKDAVKALFERTTELFCYIVDKFCQSYGDGFAGFTVHDDWGTQRAPFFSFDVGREMFVPYMRKLTDHIKSKGKIADLHSCGKSEIHAPNFVEAGWQIWCPMPMNDTALLHEQYGDKILIHVCDELFGDDATDEQQYARGEDFARRFCTPGKPVAVNGIYCPQLLTPEFCKGLYKESRRIFGS